jgi:hypothetical protein
MIAITTPIIFPETECERLEQGKFISLQGSRFIRALIPAFPRQGDFKQIEGYWMVVRSAEG